ncbi:MAG TPA: Wzz/FepE/Etk N-terminal domain-containing protein, partial [Chitinophagales bacterium]|nr:Wzz/FepE/Etk N-terminal domain-containing protein [Chitinophagales bacterium]
MNSPNKEFHKSVEQQNDQSFNWRLFLTISWINRWWIVLVFAIGVCAAFLYNRYATPIYESHADIQFKDKSKDNTIDLGIRVANSNIDRMNEEMTVLSSKGYKITALSDLPIGVSYYIRERVKAAEIYNESPFTVNIAILDSAIIGDKIDVQILDTSEYKLSYTYKNEKFSKKFSFNKAYSTPAFNINTTLNTFAKSKFKFEYFFTINDLLKESERIQEDVSIDVENLYGGEISIKYRDKNRQKTQDVVNGIADEIVKMSLHRKAESAKTVIGFIKDQIDSIEIQLFNQETLLKNFKQNNQLISPEIAETNIV